MINTDCAFEEEVLAAVVESRWPERVDAHLREHAASCAICRDLVEVTGAIGEARDRMPAPVLIPDAGRVWWIAQLRARREAIKEASRPITAAHVIALACAAGLAGACFGATSGWFQAALNWVASGKNLIPSATAMVVQHEAIAAGMAVLVFLVPAAIYLAMGRD
jgi:predicted anti-sigma-YlaC factor YlaD